MIKLTVTKMKRIFKAYWSLATNGDVARNRKSTLRQVKGKGIYKKKKKKKVTT
jgi:hypothetical protein